MMELGYRNTNVSGNQFVNPLPMQGVSYMPQFTVPGPVGRIEYTPSIIAFYTDTGHVGRLSYAANSIAYMVSPSANKFGTNQ
jgi:hypothetical protein